MVAPVITEQQEQRWREDYRARFAPLEPTPNDWHKQVRDQASAFIRADRSINWSTEFITRTLDSLHQKYPPTLNGYIDYQRDLHQILADRKAALKGEAQKPVFDTETIHQRLCWRVSKNSAKPNTYNFVSVRVEGMVEYVADDNAPEAIEQLRALNMLPARNGGICEGLVLVSFHFARSTTAMPYRQVIKVEAPAPSEDDRGYLDELLEVLGADRFGVIGDSLVDADTLKRFVEVGWVSTSNSKTKGIQYSIPDRVATFLKAGEPMAKTQPQQAAIPATQSKRWCDDDVMWQQIRKSTAANLISANIEYGDIDAVLLEICGNVASRDDIIISQDEFYRAQTAWIKEHAKPVSVLDQRFPRTANGQPVDDDDIDDDEDDNPTLPGRVPGATEFPDTMPEPGPVKKNSWASTSGGKFYDSAKNYINNIEGLSEKMGLTDDKSHRLFVLKAWVDESGKPITSLTLCPDQSYNAAWQTLTKYVADVRHMLSDYGQHFNGNTEKPNIGQLWNAVELRFKKRGLLMKTWLNGQTFGEATSGKTFDQVIGEVETWMDTFVESTKQNIRESKERQEVSKNGQGAMQTETHPTTSKPAEQTPIEEISPAESQKEIATQEPQTTPNKVIKFEPAAILIESTTLAGVPLSQLSETLNRPYKPNAEGDKPYDKITGPGGKHWTSIKGNYVRDRFDKTFGPMGIGWKISPHPTLSKVTCIEDRQRTSKRDDAGEIIYREGFTVTMENYVFQYSIVNNGQLMWVDGPCLSDSVFSEDRSYAYAGCMTSIMKQALKAFGGFNHIYGKALGWAS